MAFPVTPTIGQTTTTNGITYVYSTSSNSVGYWTRVPTTITISTSSGGSGGGSSIKSTTTSTPPAGASVGDIWYYQGTDVVYRYEYDGTTTTWIDISGPTVYAVGAFPGGITYTTNNTPPATPNVGDQWYEASTNIVYRYTYDGVSNYWVDISGYGGFSGGTVLGNVTIGSSAGNTASVGLVVNTTDAVALPIGTTAQRPANPTVGMIRYNTSGTYGLEVFVASGTSTNINLGTWTSIASPVYTVNYLLVAGGGGGGANWGGGGGAGGLVYGNTTVNSGIQYPILVGSGGTGATSSGTGTNGVNSSFNNITALGGGGGAANGGNGGSGGSGGGGGGNPGSIGVGGSGTPGQGYSGGLGVSSPGQAAAGGGGGAGGPGGAASYPGAAGAGGTGTVSAIYSGTNVYYAGGGGGGTGNAPANVGGPGGQGGGGSGANNPGNTGGAGTSNTGGGGGGGSTNNGNGGQGGSGIIIISYANPTQRASGGAVSSYSSGPNTIWVHAFTATSGFYIA